MTKRKPEHFDASNVNYKRLPPEESLGDRRLQQEEEEIASQRQRQQQQQENKKVTGMTWLSGSSSVMLTIPKMLAEKYGLTRPCTVTFEDVDTGILIRKFELDRQRRQF